MNTATNLIMVLWGFSEIYLLLKMRSGSADAKGKDKKSLSRLWLVIGFSIFFGIFIAKSTYFPFYQSQLIQLLGLLFLFLGVILRLIVINNLGKYFTVDVTIKKDHQLKTDGFYKYVRHPSYAFSLLTFLGLAIVLNNYISAVIVFVPVFLMFLYRIKIEEQVLTEQFGQDYSDYRNKTKRLIPFIY
ncbi:MULTISPECIES: isoprenylcysteine carboxylmethyltransferase family protein [unclassified Kaistella]|uniref:methyltransferase family protein n=1 Tax=unclassified Kaistella TaxID=2762626 RepID=UPI00273331D6|nr:MULTISPECIES: isoprenylcysteine carboxylmethyltransferase family protein [unclassified Kaistella]MDP2452980.1 isoprenylcysteine carboxylmethyltransferase family protein [Kaistella sp. SH11-4b]MDP2455889.1 isoprenylcysteine carboxylmethyltransferase family protein [Kaistella sp. SH40-3]MDP2458793.1 isoprenylcysteine carboxylmethyltransferase family protein [Kaistella sp. SH19-2b]